MGFLGGSDGKQSALQCGRPRFDLWAEKIPWRRELLPTPVVLPGEFNGQRSLVGYMGLHGVHATWGPKESDTTKQLTLSLERRIPLVEDGRFQLWKQTTVMEGHGWRIMWVCKCGHTFFFLLINQHHMCELSLMRLSLFCAKTISPVGHFKSGSMSGSASISSIRIRDQLADQYSS